MAITKIATVTVGSGGASSIDLTSIPGTMTDLLLVTSLRESTGGSGGSNTKLNFNGSTSGYSERMLRGLSGSAASYSQSGTTIGWNYDNLSGSTSNTFNNASIYIPNYAGSTYKSVSLDTVVENNSAEGFQVINAALWSNTAAITSIVLAPGAGTFVQYSTATLYGVTKGSLAGVTVS